MNYPIVSQLCLSIAVMPLYEVVTITFGSVSAGIFIALATQATAILSSVLTGGGYDSTFAYF